MTGGLIQIASAAVQDVFLIGNPQITFFKAVYRRHTNFALETVELPLIGAPIAFGETLTCRIDKIGDLMWKTHLVVDLPRIAIPRPPVIDGDGVAIVTTAPFQQAHTSLHASYIALRQYVGLTMDMYRQTIRYIQPENPRCTNTVYRHLCNLLTVRDPVSAIQTAFAAVIVRDCPPSGTGGVQPADQLVNRLSLVTVSQTVPANQLRAAFDDVVSQLQLLESRYWLAYRSAVDHHHRSDGIATGTSPLTPPTPHCKFAWIRRLGHFIAEWIDIYIGNHKIDRQWGEWINIWYELTGSHDQMDTYNALIGDVPELTNFDATPKPAYTLAVPIPFWFCRDNGLALPLIALDYDDVELVVKFRNMEDVCFTDTPHALDPDIVKIADAKFWVDYVYLDAGERKRFAQSGHEYLIQQVQREDHIDFSLSQHNFDLHFNNPVRELVWIHQRSDITANRDDTVEPQWGNYTLDRWPVRCRSGGRRVPRSVPLSTIDIGYGLVPNRDSGTCSGARSDAVLFAPPATAPRATRVAINTAQLVLNQQTRTEVEEPRFFENLQTYQHHRNGGAPGINVLSFALNPEITQPTGSCNYSMIDKSSIDVVFNHKHLYDDNGRPVSGRFTVYALSSNVLRIMSGVGAVAFE